MDGSHMVDYLLSEGYFVIGTSRSPQIHPHLGNLNFIFSELDIRDSFRFEDLVTVFKIKEVYNFAGISFFPDSLKDPNLNFEINRDSAITMARTCSSLGIKFVQASSSEIFPDSPNCLLHEKSRRDPSSPYSIAKYEVDVVLKDLRNKGHEMYTAILFSHESERRKPQFLVRKISLAVSRIQKGLQDQIILGDLNTRRDWSSSRHFVKWMNLITKHDPDEYVLASGASHSIEDLLDIAFNEISISNWRNYVLIDESLNRVSSRNHIVGDSSKIEKITSMNRDSDFKDLIKNIVNHDLKWEKTKAIVNLERI
jgi:GDPmannose 4,6-dehydratase